MYADLTKARLSALVLLTTAVGYVVADLGHMHWSRLGWTMVGTGLAAACASALNQVWELQRDARMQRTQARPLPSGELSRGHALAAACVMGVAGVALLAALVHVLAAGLALLTIVIYVLAYTPLKARTTLNTLVGAVCGAIPPMIGWVAAEPGGGSQPLLAPGAWVLGAILFVWQLPHFLALAWLYREDYERGGFVMLPVIDRDGRITGRAVMLTSALLIPVALMLTLLNVAGVMYAIGSIVLGLWMFALSVRLMIRRTNGNARAVFLASITYLPLLLCLMVIDRGPM